MKPGLRNLLKRQGLPCRCIFVYKVFCLDRSAKTHPIDPNNANKFLKNRGGVLIAIRKGMNIVSTRLEFQCSGEIRRVTLKYNDVRKLIYV